MYVIVGKLPETLRTVLFRVSVKTVLELEVIWFPFESFFVVDGGGPLGLSGG